MKQHLPKLLAALLGLAVTAGIIAAKPNDGYGIAGISWSGVISPPGTRGTTE